MKYSTFFGVVVIAFVVGCSFTGQEPEDFFQKLLSHADIKINGDRPWDITVHNNELYARVLRDGSLGLGEAYMDGWWDCPSLDEFFFRVLRARMDEKMSWNWPTLFMFLKAKLLNLQTSNRAFEVGQKHYDLGNDLFERMLDKRLVYSCGYWDGVADLDLAQEKKLDLICRKLNLEPGMTVLDIGCGWASFACYAAQKYGVHVTGVTISKEQVLYAQELCRGLPVEIRLQDYREIQGTFDRVVSVGMFEHVGHKNYTEFMKVVSRCLKDDGLALLHTIGNNVTTNTPDTWITKYIFPNGALPSMTQISSAIEGFFIMEDWHNFGADYDRTLMAWFDRFNEAWPSLSKKYDDRFYRMWKYYLLSCAGLFRARAAQLWQLVLSKNGLLGGYKSPR